MLSCIPGAMNTKNVINAYRNLAIARWPHGSGGFIVFVNGEVLREKRHHNERVFASEDGALKAGQRARRS